MTESPNPLFRLPQELRDQIFFYVFTLPPRPSVTVGFAWGHSQATTRYRLTTTEAEIKIRAAGEPGIDTWSDFHCCCVASRMLETAILRTSKQMHEDARDSLYRKIFKSQTSLQLPPSALLATSAPPRKTTTNITPQQDEFENVYTAILQNAIMLELVPFSWQQLQQCIKLLASSSLLQHVPIDLGRMRKNLEYQQWPRLKEVKSMLAELSKIRAACSAIIVGASMMYPEGIREIQEASQIFLRAKKIAEEIIVGKSTEEDEGWLKSPSGLFFDYRVDLLLRC